MSSQFCISLKLKIYKFIYFYSLHSSLLLCIFINLISHFFIFTYLFFYETYSKRSVVIGLMKNLIRQMSNVNPLKLFCQSSP